MNWDEVLDIARREATGEQLSGDDRVRFERYIAEHPERLSDIRFEQVLASTIVDTPTVSAPLNFVDSIMSALPARPVLLPEPSLVHLWNWIAGGVGAGLISSAVAWNWRGTWLGWLSRLGTGFGSESGATQIDWYLFFHNLTTQAADITSPTVIVGAALALGAFAWGAVRLAESPS